MRVLMVLESSFPTRGGGGAESQLATLSTGLRRRGVRTVVVTPRRHYRQELSPVGRHAGAAVCRIGYPSIPGVGALVLLARLALLLIAQRRRIDAVHVHIAHYMALVCCALGPLLGLRVVVKVSGWWELDRGLLAAGTRRSWRGRVARRLLRRAYAFQAISRRVAGALQEEGFDPARIHLLPNAVDLDRFRPHAAPAQGMRTAIYVGRLVPEKGLDTLVAALARAPELRLRVVGAGDCLEALCAQVDALGLQARVDFIGHSDGIAAELAQAHVGVLPSMIEGLSNT
ncbi:MAG TPA: glycosyltransferase, partial [Mizugakiibacter sp.]